MYVRPSGKYGDSGDLYPFTFLEDTFINPIQIKEGRWADYADYGHHIDLPSQLLGPSLGGRLRPPQRLDSTKVLVFVRMISFRNAALVS